MVGKQQFNKKGDRETFFKAYAEIHGWLGHMGGFDTWTSVVHEWNG